jgi:hypothetical protein
MTVINFIMFPLDSLKEYLEVDDLTVKAKFSAFNGDVV